MDQHRVCVHIIADTVPGITECFSHDVLPWRISPSEDHVH
jgi:hypothetical protein